MWDLVTAYGAVIAEHWTTWLVTLVLIVAATIDGFELKVPNWITLPFIVAGWFYSTLAFGWEGLGWSLLGTAIGLALLLPAYAIGGMGAGDVKLLAGVGAWIYGTHTVYAFSVSAIVGAALAVALVLVNRAWKRHSAQFWVILNEIMVIRNPEQLAAIAAERKPSMLLLPYGIPIAIGTIGYFVWTGMLV
jgi:prepilin peptidase CpaA